MKQIVQNIRNGETELVTVPAPICSEHEVLIHVHSSLISAGTERMLINFGKSSLLNKARSQPERVAQVISKIKTDGLVSTLESVTAKLNQPIPLGYSNAGIVIAVGAKVQGFSVGDRVCSNGKHAEFVAVPETLCAKIPDSVSFDQACFASVAAIALHSVRLAGVNIGDRVAVIGLGLIGLLTAQVLQSQGCQTVGIDFDMSRMDQCKSCGATVFAADHLNLIDQCLSFTDGHGFDAVIITASTSSNEPVSLAAKISRQRGKVILVGVVGLELNRDEFYKKELVFQVSCSYGPGRYDLNYEEKAQDYPFGLVRWTAQRNFSAVLELIRDKRINVNSLVSHCFVVDDFKAAYQAVMESASSLAVILHYSSEALYSPIEENSLLTVPNIASINRPTIAIIGAGNYSSRILASAFSKSSARIKFISSASGLSSYLLARKVGADFSASGLDVILKDPDIDAVIIATKHSAHFGAVIAAFEHKKHVFVEKPLCLSLDELEMVNLTQKNSPDLSLMIGFNRRFSVFTMRLKQWLKDFTEPKSIIITVNAGYLPSSHWTQDVQVGGGRIIGEACHFVDLMRFIVGSDIVSVNAIATTTSVAIMDTHDTVSITLGFKDGSHGVIHYFANGHRNYPKETIEVFTSGQVFVIDNFRKLTSFGSKKFRKISRFRQDKGQLLCAKKFIESLTNGSPSPIPFEEIYQVTHATIEADRQIRQISTKSST